LLSSCSTFEFWKKANLKKGGGKFGLSMFDLNSLGLFANPMEALISFWCFKLEVRLG
jgi:hypothetical protein